MLAVAIAFLPSVVLGLLLNDLMKAYLFSAWVVAAALVLGGVVILLVERTATTRATTTRPRCRRASRWRSGSARRSR